MLNCISLFSGIGGLDLGLSKWCNIRIMCEIDATCQKILKKNFPECKILDNVKLIEKEAETYDILCGGFPCQDISHAGKGKGFEGERSGLIYQVFRIVKQNNIPIIFLENVQMLRKRGLDIIINQFNDMGYDLSWLTIDALSVNALHRRARIFILAIKRNYIKPNIKEYINTNNVWLTEPNIARVSKNNCIDRIKCLGNSVIPQHAEYAFYTLYTGLNNGIENLKRDLPSCGYFINGKIFQVNFPKKNIENIIFPPTIQRFKITHSLPTPTATEYILRKPTNTLLNRSFRPGVNKSVSLNRYIQIFPDKNTPKPELDKDGLLINELQLTYFLNPEWVEWLMGFDIGWTNV